MRVARLSPVLGLWCAGIGAVFFACGSDVEDSPNNAAGGAGGAGSSSSTTATTTGSVSSSTSSSTVASSSTGVFDGPCEEACDKIANECGFGPVCEMLEQLDCETSPSADCYGECVLAASCADIAAAAGGNPPPELLACVSGCQGGQGGAGGGGQDCLGCGQDNCAGEGLTCFNDDACQAWLNCVNGCGGDAGCLADCDSTHAAAQPLYSALEECLCTSCSSECAAQLDPCGTGTGAGGTGGV